MSEAVERQLVAMLYSQTATLVIAGAAFTSVIALCWVRTGHLWFLFWCIAALIGLFGRLAIEFAYRHRRETSDDIRTWRIRFTIGAWVMGAIWGAAALTVVNHEEPLVQLFAINVESVIIMGAAARNASCPLAARGQVLLGLGPLFVALLAADNPYYRAYSLFCLFGFFAAQTLIHHLYDQHVRFLCMNEDNVALVGEVREANLELAAANERLERAATTDSLTGIANRRRFDSSLADEVRRAQRYRTDLALLFLDVDAFKGFNDLYGHQAGDECLQRIAAAFASVFHRPGDLVARYGGEEFAAILPQTGVEVALELAEAVRCAIQALALLSAASACGVVTVSIGVASFDAGRYRRPEDFIRSADEALYAAKASGRNCVRNRDTADEAGGLGSSTSSNSRVWASPNPPVVACRINPTGS